VKQFILAVAVAAVASMAVIVFAVPAMAGNGAVIKDMTTSPTPKAPISPPREGGVHLRGLLRDRTTSPHRLELVRVAAATGSSCRCGHPDSFRIPFRGLNHRCAEDVPERMAVLVSPSRRLSRASVRTSRSAFRAARPQGDLR
jgi:hypothetical protein